MTAQRRYARAGFCALSVCVIAPCTPGAVPASHGLTAVPDPHSGIARASRIEANISDSVPPGIARAIAPAQCTEVVVRQFELAPTELVGSLYYSAVVTVEMQDLNGDGVIQADAGFYGAYAGPSEVLNLSIDFFTLGIGFGDEQQLHASYQNVTGSTISYPYLYFEWDIATDALSSWDLGADPGVFTFGGPSVTPVPGAFFWDRTNPTAYGTMQWASLVDIDSLIDSGDIVNSYDAGGTFPRLLGFGGDLSVIARGFFDPDAEPNEELLIIDNSNPLDPQVVDTIPRVFNRYSSVHIRGDRMVVTREDQFGDFQSRFDVYDISDPSNPAGAGGGLVFFARGLGITEDRFYIVNEEAVDVFQIAPSFSHLGCWYIGFTDFPDGAVAGAGDYAYINREGMVRVYELTGPFDAIEVGALPESALVHVVGDALYVNAADPLVDGFDVYDITNPGAPAFVQTVALPDAHRHFQIEGDEMHVLAGTHLLTFDISTPTAPNLTETFSDADLGAPATRFGRFVASPGFAGQYDVLFGGDLAIAPTGGIAGDGTAVGGFAYVADGAAGVTVLDVRDPIVPTPVGTVALPGPAKDAKSLGPYVYATHDGVGSGVSVINASNPDAPVLLGTLELDQVGDIAPDGDRAFVGAESPAGGYRVVVVEAAPTRAPAMVNEIGVVGDASSLIAYSDSVLYVTDGAIGSAIQIFEVTPSGSLSMLSSVQPDHMPTAIAVQDGALFVLGVSPVPGEPDLVYIYDVTTPDSPQLLTTYGVNDVMTDLELHNGRLFVLGDVGGETTYAVDVSQACFPRLIGVQQGRVGAPGVGIFRSGGVLMRGSGSAGLAITDVSRAYGETDSDLNGTPDALEPAQNVTQGTGFAAIQGAFGNASDGDVIELESGVHFEDGVVFPSGIDVTLRGHGRGHTWINAGGGTDTEPALNLEGTGQSSATTISDMTIFNGVNEDILGGGAMRVVDASPVIRRVDFLDSAGPGPANGAAHLWSGGGATPVIDSCTFFGGTSAYDAVTANGSGHLDLIQCVIADNDTAEAVRLDTAGNTAVNCTIVGDDTGLGRAIFSFGGQTDVHNTVIVGFTATQNGAVIDLTRCLAPIGVPGDNVPGAPAFVDRPGRDLRLAAGSLGIDAGDADLLGPGVTLDAARRPRFVDEPATANTGRGSVPYLDIGAYEHQGPNAGLCPADIDGDGDADIDDIQGFVDAFLVSDQAADIDGDGDTDVDDIQGFVDAFLIGCA